MFKSFRDAWHDRAWRTEFGVTLIVLVPVLYCLTHFLDAIERRQGAVLEDPVLIRFPAIDLTWITFLVIYAGIIVALVVLIRHPRRLLLVFQGYALMALLRMVSMYLAPFDAPPGIIELRDPFVEFFGGGRTLTRDLFFSGHTSTMFLLFLNMPGKTLKIIYACCTIVVGSCVVLQHVHYTVDVVAAPFFAYGAYRIVLGICIKRGILVN